MAKHKEEKTNVMRVLDQKKIPYTAHTYDPESGIDGVSVARSLGQDPASVFKTLVARGASGGYYVFDIPVAATLDLKKAAHAVGEMRRLPRRKDSGRFQSCLVAESSLTRILLICFPSSPMTEE